MAAGDLEERSLRDLTPAASLFQSPFWAYVKARNGWTHRVYSLKGKDPFLVLIKRWGPFTLGYAPGIDESHIPHDGATFSDVADDISRFVRGMFCLRFDSEYHLDIKADRCEFSSQNTLIPGFDIQPVDTVIIHTASEHPRKEYRTRAVRQIRKAERQGITCGWEHDSTWFSHWYALYRETSRRCGFLPRSGEYLLHLLQYGGDQARPRLALAWKDGIPAAGAMVMIKGGRAWYLYGATGAEGLSHGAMYCLQDWIIRDLHDRGIGTYNLYGTAPRDVADHHLGSLSLFKSAFGGTSIRMLGLVDCPVMKGPYRLFRYVENKRITRARGPFDPDFSRH